MNKEVQRNFIIGDHWLYYKIYSGPKTSDTILTECIKPVAEYLLQEQVIDKWFFIRYSDPKHHIRVRFHSPDPSQLGTVISTLYTFFEEFMDNDFIWKLQLDTYKRELERYGTNTMELSETLFYHDSKMVVDFIDLIEGDEGEELRWLFSLRAMNSFLDSLKYTSEKKIDLLNKLKTSFQKEFGGSKSLIKQLSDKLRNERKKIENFMTFDEHTDADYVPILHILNERERNIEQLATEILEYKASGSLEVELDNLVASYLHMFMNRLFKSKNRLHEMVCYDFLYQHQKSMAARKRVKRMVSV